MPPTLADRLRHVLDAITDINEILKNKNFDEFASNRLLCAATERLLEIVSEASRHIPEDIKARETSIPWQRVADLGNRLRHAYHRVDPNIIWRIAKGDLASLQAFAEKVIREAD
ncbi:MAG TPA: HepT-like ribonuclease domain-containing protein [Xanthobacteraceae bacterium]|nr:HepT-like ribonuclease domain-containing protein [Xanthobacteraceae bacterium]